MKHLIIAACIIFSSNLIAQHNNSELPTSIRTDGLAPDGSAILDVQSNNKGILIPRMSESDRLNISSPANGLLLYQTDMQEGFWYNLGDGAVPNWHFVGEVGMLTDGDDNTRVYVEQSLDENKIRFEIEGTEFFVMDSSRIEFLNTGNSIFLGDDAGYNDNLSNHQNIAIGRAALRNNYRNDNNIAIGDSSMYNTSDNQYDSNADNNIAIGAKTLFNNDDGHDNVIIGNESLMNIEDGNYNTTLGAKTLRDFSGGGHGNTALGYYAMNKAGGSNKVALGRSALENTSAGEGTIAIGYQALQNKTTTDFYSIAIGYQAMHFNKGVDNIAIGASSLTKDGIGARNVALGRYALRHNLGSDNIGIGFQSLSSSSSSTNAASKNLAIGNYTMNDITTGNNNVALGYHALEDIETANDNIAIGTDAMRQHSVGDYNVAIGRTSQHAGNGAEKNVSIGYSSLSQIDTGDDNVAIGYRTDAGNSSGSLNTIIGSESNINNSDGNYNTLIGAQSNGGNLSGHNNTMIGYQAGKNNTTHTKSGSVFIGYQSGNGETTDNKLYIENSDSSNPLIYGDFGTNNLGLNADVAIGGNTPSAHAALDIQSTTKGILFPRMTLGQRALLPNLEGMVIYQTDNNEGLYFNDGITWDKVNQEQDKIFDGDGDTQVTTSQTDDNITMNTNGVERLNIRSDGKIGINTSGNLAQVNINSPDDGLWVLGGTGGPWGAVAAKFIGLDIDGVGVDINAGGTGLISQGGTLAAKFLSTPTGGIGVDIFADDTGLIAEGGTYGIVGKCITPAGYAIRSDGRFRSDKEAEFLDTVFIGKSTKVIADGFLLNVDGKIISEEVLIQDVSNWPDYVFESDYNLMSLNSVENFIIENKHLPDVPSAAEVEKSGIMSGEMDKLLMRKIEELTLHLIKQQKEIEELKFQMNLNKK